MHVLLRAYNAYFCARQAMPLPVHHRDVLKRLPSLLPYPPAAPRHYQAVYATHIAVRAQRLRREAALVTSASARASLSQGQPGSGAGTTEPDTVAEIVEH
jgi:hypothetical protein